MTISMQDMEAVFHDGAAWRTIPVVCNVRAPGESSKTFWEREVARLRLAYSLPQDTLIVRERRGW